MNFYTWLAVLDGQQEIKVLDTNTLVTLYEGQKNAMPYIRSGLEVTAVYTKANKIVVEVK